MPVVFHRAPGIFACFAQRAAASWTHRSGHPALPRLCRRRRPASPSAHVPSNATAPRNWQAHQVQIVSRTADSLRPVEAPPPVRVTRRRTALPLLPNLHPAWNKNRRFLRACLTASNPRYHRRFCRTAGHRWREIAGSTRPIAVRCRTTFFRSVESASNDRQSIGRTRPPVDRRFRPRPYA